jgi:ABC-type transport system involved in Fe-S cluster assembly fused permease/ATPase subunit
VPLPDEAPATSAGKSTSNIDRKTETEILRDLFARRENWTGISVTRRVHTATPASQIRTIRVATKRRDPR